MECCYRLGRRSKGRLESWVEVLLLRCELCGVHVWYIDCLLYVAAQRYIPMIFALPFVMPSPRLTSRSQLLNITHRPTSSHFVQQKECTQCEERHQDRAVCDRIVDKGCRPIQRDDVSYSVLCVDITVGKSSAAAAAAPAACAHLVFWPPAALIASAISAGGGASSSGGLCSFSQCCIRCVSPTAFNSRCVSYCCRRIGSLSVRHATLSRRKRRSDHSFTVSL